MSRTHILLRRAALTLLVLAALTAFALAADVRVSTPEAYYQAVEENLREQNRWFSIEYTGNMDRLGLEDPNDLGLIQRNMCALAPDSPDSADYPALNMATGHVRWQGKTSHFDMTYMAAPEELEEVARQAAGIVDSLELDGEDDYVKVKLLYEYICTHFTYDDTLSNFTAYDGLMTGEMVCQGYALLTSHVMWEAGIPCRIVTGTSAMENHAWNIVELDGLWYYLDTTWDAADEIGGVSTWNFFLKGTGDFTDHTPFDPYLTDAYQTAHPMAQTGLGAPQIQVQVNGGDVVRLVVRAGVPVQLTAILPEGVEADVEWESANPEIIEVTADGWTTASRLGETVITAQVAGSRGLIAAQIPTESVDLRTASPWAFEIVTDYYLNQLLPVSLCADFQQGITRAELARLCDQYIAYQVGWDPYLVNNPFTDTRNCPDVSAILRVRSIGLMQGTSETTFHPDEYVTREQAAKVLVRLMEHLDNADYAAAGAPACADAAQVSEWARPFVAAVMESGVMQGIDGSFHPRDPMTLEQMVVAMHRVYAARAGAAAAA